MNDTRSISREAAEEALRQRDWHRAFEYWANVSEVGGRALEWLGVMETAALPYASAGDLAAQQVLGSIGICQYTGGPPSEIEPLRRGLRWIVAALRQELSPSGLQMLVVWYGSLQAQGMRDQDIESFLSEPEPRAAWRKWTGADLP